MSIHAQRFGDNHPKIKAHQAPALACPAAPCARALAPNPTKTGRDPCSRSIGDAALGGMEAGDVGWAKIEGRPWWPCVVFQRRAGPKDNERVASSPRLRRGSSAGRSSAKSDRTAPPERRRAGSRLATQRNCVSRPEEILGPGHDTGRPPLRSWAELREWELPVDVADRPAVGPHQVIACFLENYTRHTARTR